VVGFLLGRDNLRDSHVQCLGSTGGAGGGEITRLLFGKCSNIDRVRDYPDMDCPRLIFVFGILAYL